jgi:hypothetical protein
LRKCAAFFLKQIFIGSLRFFFQRSRINAAVRSRRARVLKRELYALVGNKQEMLIACISERAKRFDVPADLHVLHDREILAQVLASFGTKLVREISDPIEDHRFMKCRCDISH